MSNSSGEKKKKKKKKKEKTLNRVNLRKLKQKKNPPQKKREIDTQCDMHNKTEQTIFFFCPLICLH